MPNLQQLLNAQLALLCVGAGMAAWALLRGRRGQGQPLQPAPPPPAHPGGPGPPGPPGPPAQPGAPRVPHRRRRAYRGPNIPRVRLTPAGMSPAYVLRTYRLDMNTILSILQEIAPHLEPTIVTQRAVPPLCKLLSVLHFCATGSFQHTVGMSHGISQPMFCRILNQVLVAMRRYIHRHIYLPRDQAALIRNKTAFHAIAGMPNTVGAVDCVHVGLVPPHTNEASYRNRKMQHTLNVQMACDADLCIMHVCARYPGSSHDAFILRGSYLQRYMEQHAGQHMWLLGECVIHRIGEDSVAGQHPAVPSKLTLHSVAHRHGNDPLTTPAAWPPSGNYIHPPSSRHMASTEHRGLHPPMAKLAATAVPRPPLWYCPTQPQVPLQ